MIETMRTCILLLGLALLANLVSTYNYRNFPKYAFKRKYGNEKVIKQLSTECESSEKCTGLSRLELVKCIRQCISQNCYQELYGEDELEEGEIDVRYNSFKGCVLVERKEKIEQ